MINFFYESQSDYQKNPEEAQSLLAIGASPPSVFDDLSQGAALTFSISLIYNLDEAKYR